MSEPLVQQRFSVGTVVWAVSAYGHIISGPVTDVSPRGAAVHFIVTDGNEVAAHPAFATEVEAVKYAIEQADAHLYALKARLRTLGGGAV